MSGYIGLGRLGWPLILSGDIGLGWPLIILSGDIGLGWPFIPKVSKSFLLCCSDI